jgi:hypothetical protein
MAVCKWLSLHVCKKVGAVEESRPDISQGFNAVVVWKGIVSYIVLMLWVCVCVCVYDITFNHVCHILFVLYVCINYCDSFRCAIVVGVP